MKYQTARILAFLKLIIGWVLFVPCLLWTTAGSLKFLLAYTTSVKDVEEGTKAFVIDFLNLMMNMVESNVKDMPFIGFYWNSAATPKLGNGFLGGENMLFMVMFWGIFLGLAFMQSSERLFRQLKNIRQGLDDLMVIENSRGEDARSRAELMDKLKLKHHSIFLQFFPLYIFPIVIIVVVHYGLGFLGVK